MIHHQAIAVVTVGVENIDRALDLWSGTLGFRCLERKRGSDPSLSRLWDLEPDRIVDQVLLGTPGVESGRLHLVQFRDPLPPVRQGAANTDLCPKNLDVACTDLPTRFKELQTAGFTFRSDWVQYSIENLEVREVQMGVHDELNLVFVELIGQKLPYTAQGYAGLTSLVSIVPDVAAEERFYADLLGLPSAGRHLLDGPAIEKMIGLPAGGSLDVRLLSSPDEVFGRVELIQYRGIVGDDLYPRARPGALGFLHVGFLTTDLTIFRQRAENQNVAVCSHEPVETLYGQGRVDMITSPAGQRIEIHERQP
jgi:catechol 2,3-dioxygenase-like lactoylglutathione lyase family enzyme